ncbi:ABC-three component system middle component 1 [Rossellomorea marisflavi]|uniref:ABC-three component system middle component 1 n=1 Tax=Rossellomorea marisflavi TaxID=189381 RepID=UPI0039BF283F
MKHETVIKILEEKKFEQFQLESEVMTQLDQLNISIWASDSKLVLVKEYRTKSSLIEWKLEDQIYISSVLQYFPKKYINNLYFFMVLDFNSGEIALRLEINKIEKNDLVCKKYVLKNDDDLNRVPFLMNLIIETEEFSFDEKFQERIVKFKEEVGEEKFLNLEIILNDYFTNNKQSRKIKIDTLLETGD